MGRFTSRVSVALTTLTLVAVGLWTHLPASLGDDLADWPQFHGPKRDNISTETGLLKAWPDGGPKLLWTAQGIGRGFSTVAIANRTIYTTGTIDDATVISALDTDGRIRWQVPAGAAWTGASPGARSTPTLDGDRLYHESPHGDLVCLNAATGEKIWAVNILDRFGSENIQWALSESPLIDGGRVICCPGGPRAAIVALNKHTGKVVWKSPSTGDLAGYGSPVLAECQGLRMILTMTSHAVIAVSADGGDLLWRFEYVTPFAETIFTPIYHDGQVFISTRTVGSAMLKLDVDGQKASVKALWRTKELDNQHGGVVLRDGYLYGANHPRNGGDWVCLDWATGERKYSERGVGRGALTCADHMLYTFSERGGIVGLVPAVPERHEVVSQFQIPPRGKGPAWAHPVVCGARLYLRHGDYLYAYDIRADPRYAEILDLHSRNFPLVDFHVHLKGGLTLEEALAHSKRVGIKYGIAPNCGLGFPITDDAGIDEFLKNMEGQPVFLGMQAEGREWVNMFSKEAIARFDYVFTDAMTFTDDRGKRIRLWVKEEVQIDDAQAFMEMYVDRTVSILNDEPIDVLANPTFLPKCIADRYDELWTEARIDAVIAAAVKNSVAIEINARNRIPSPALIKRAKRAGAKFAFGTNNGNANLGRLEYCLDMIQECGLTPKDMFMPK